jgi:hypothetical protein
LARETVANRHAVALQRHEAQLTHQKFPDRLPRLHRLTAEQRPHIPGALLKRVLHGLDGGGFQIERALRLQRGDLGHYHLLAGLFAPERIEQGWRRRRAFGDHLAICSAFSVLAILTKPLPCATIAKTRRMISAWPS